MAKYPFRNLIFQGGGVKALAYHGALAVLDEHGILPQIERVGGTSAGALTAAIVALRLPLKESTAIIESLDLKQISARASSSLPDKDSQPMFATREFRRLQRQFNALTRFVGDFGWNSVGYTTRWLEDMLATHAGDGRITFREFREAGFRDLHVVVTNVSAHRTEIFSADTTPNAAVADAILMSQAIPLYYEALQFDGTTFGKGDYYADGGILLNYPINLFDGRAFSVRNRWFVNGVNWQTLGFRFYTPPDCRENNGEIRHVVSYIQHIFESLRTAQDVQFSHSRADQLRSVSINNCCVQTTDFSIEPSAEDKRYVQLVEAGRQATERYLTHYRPPVIKPAYYHLLRGMQQWVNGRAFF